MIRCRVENAFKGCDGGRGVLTVSVRRDETVVGIERTVWTGRI